MVAARRTHFDGPWGIACNAGDIYVADTMNDTIRKITPGGLVTTLAGQLGTYGSAEGRGAAAHFDGPVGIACDAAGNLYLADSNNDTIRRITPCWAGHHPGRTSRHAG